MTPSSITDFARIAFTLAVVLAGLPAAARAKGPGLS
jgi:hypothetical protein